MTEAYDLRNYKLTLPCNASGELFGKAYFKRGAYFQDRERLGLVCAVEHLKTP